MKVKIIKAIAGMNEGDIKEMSNTFAKTAVANGWGEIVKEDKPKLKGPKNTK